MTPVSQRSPQPFHAISTRRIAMTPLFELPLPTSPSQPPQPLALILTRSSAQLVRPPALKPRLARPWTLTSWIQTFLDAFALMPMPAQSP